jgi:hypothetical protein
MKLNGKCTCCHRRCTSAGPERLLHGSLVVAGSPLARPPSPTPSSNAISTATEPAVVPVSRNTAMRPIVVVCTVQGGAPCSTRPHNAQLPSRRIRRALLQLTIWHQIDPWLASGMLVASEDLHSHPTGPHVRRRCSGPVQRRLQTVDLQSLCERRSHRLALYEVRTWALPPSPYVPPKVTRRGPPQELSAMLTVEWPYKASGVATLVASLTSWPHKMSALIAACVWRSRSLSHGASRIRNAR